MYLDFIGINKVTLEVVFAVCFSSVFASQHVLTITKVEKFAEKAMMNVRVLLNFFSSKINFN